MTPLVAPALDQYVRDLIPARDAVLAEMEAYAAENDVPVVGPAVGTLLEILALSIGAGRVFEMGSAIGYSTAFFARAVGRGGQVVYTDGDPANAARARGYLERMELLERVAIKVGDAVGSLEATTGYFDVIFIDVDKEGYPAALKAAAPRVRRGGYLVADNVLWSGKVIDAGVRDAATEGIRHFNQTLFSLQEFRSVIVPLRDGVAIARREG
jgi:caffeoyl-CoA O-methyltransferase